VYALKTGDGSIIWRNDTCGYRYNSVPHSEGMAGVVPQGFMALHEDTLVVTTGRGSPALFDRKSGKLLAHRNGWSKLHTPGGSWAMAGKGAVFFERCVTAGDRRVPPGEADFRKEELGTGLLAIDCRTGHEVFATRDRSRGVLAGDTMLLYGGGPVMSVDAGGFFRVAPRYHRKEDGWPSKFRGVDYAKRLWPQTDVFPIAPAQFKRWETDVGRTYTLIRAGRTVVAGGRGAVTALAADTGEIVWRAEVDGQARGLAAAVGRDRQEGRGHT
ncbi:MAG: outer membrane protein assembly factor BamB family protein, partial [Planctomycetota bacterium]|jgi:outer membrane protein assembly factor BamB